MDLDSRAAHFTPAVIASLWSAKAVEMRKLFVEWNNLADWFSEEAYSVNWNVHWQQIYAWTQQVFQRACIVSVLGGLEMVILVFFGVW